MKKQPPLFLIFMTILAMLFLSACGVSSAPTAEPAEPTSPPAETVNEEPTEESVPSESEPTAPPENTESTETESEGPTLDENGVPTDVPLMEGFYDLKVEANNSRIIYRIPGTVQDVVTFYQAELAGFGWDKVLGADSAIGSMGAMGRQNAVGDKISLSLSYNPNGNFVMVVIDVHRSA